MSCYNIYQYDFMTEKKFVVPCSDQGASLYLRAGDEIYHIHRKSDKPLARHWGFDQH